MIRVCSYCKIKYGEKEPFDDKSLTHGVCLDCYNKLVSEVSRLSFDDFLEMFDTPVLILDSIGRLHAANQDALNALEKPLDRIKGLMGGDALECAYAKEKDGCGQTSHCAACTIRNLVMDTVDNKKSKHKEPVCIKTKEKIINGYASAFFLNGAVCIIFEEHFIESI